MKIKYHFIVFLITVSVLLIPLLFTLLSNEVDWSALDFLVGGILLYGTGIAVAYGLKKISKTGYKILYLIVIFFLFFFIWAQLAVGVL